MICSGWYEIMQTNSCDQYQFKTMNLQKVRMNQCTLISCKKKKITRSSASKKEQKFPQLGHRSWSKLVLEFIWIKEKQALITIEPLEFGALQKKRILGKKNLGNFVWGEDFWFLQRLNNVDKRIRPSVKTLIWAIKPDKAIVLNRAGP